MYADKVNVCLLARIEHCEEYPHKMAFDEVFNEHVSKNVRNNNNIVTRNLWVQDVDTTNGPQRPPFWRFGNYLPTTQEIDFGFDVDSTIFQQWTIKLYFDNLIWNAWTSNGSLGSGFSVIPGQNAVTVTSYQVRMNTFTLDAFQMGFIQAEFVPINENNISMGVFDCNMTQYRIDSLNAEEIGRAHV